MNSFDRQGGFSNATAMLLTMFGALALCAVCSVPYVTAYFAIKKSESFAEQLNGRLLKLGGTLQLISNANVTQPFIPRLENVTFEAHVQQDTLKMLSAAESLPDLQELPDLQQAIRPEHIAEAKQAIAGGPSAILLGWLTGETGAILPPEVKSAMQQCQTCHQPQ